MGNRFNILFLNAAGVFFLYPHLLEFFGNLDDSNRLLNAVNDDLNVLVYRVSCKALGLIHKKVTGPLWRKMVEVESNLHMNEHYKLMVDKFEQWSNDPTPFLSGGDSLFPNLVHQDEVYEKLVAPFDHDDMVKPLLEIIFSGFVTLSKRMLYDHLEGVHANPSESLLNEARAVPTTNVIAERDFGMLDRLMKAKPKAIDIALEGIIMCRVNKTEEWRDRPPPC